MPPKKAAQVHEDDGEWVTASSKKSAGAKKPGGDAKPAAKQEQTASAKSTSESNGLAKISLESLAAQLPTVVASASAPLPAPPSSAPSAVKEAHDALEKQRQASDAKYTQAQNDVKASFAAFATALRQRESTLLAELAGAHKTELDFLSQKQATLKGLSDAYEKAAEAAKPNALGQIDAFRNTARAEDAAWNVSRYVDNNGSVLHQISIAGGVFHPPLGAAAKHESAAAPKAAKAEARAASAKQHQPATAPVQQPAPAAVAAPIVAPAPIVISPLATVPADISALIRPLGSSTTAAQSDAAKKPAGETKKGHAASTATPASAPASTAKHAASKEDDSWETPKGQRKPRNK